MPYYIYDGRTEEWMKECPEFVKIIEENEIGLFLKFKNSNSNSLEDIKNLLFPTKKTSHIIYDRSISALSQQIEITVWPFSFNQAHIKQLTLCDSIENWIKLKELIPTNSAETTVYYEMSFNGEDVIKLLIKYKLLPQELLYLDIFYGYLINYRKAKIEELTAIAAEEDEMQLIDLVSLSSGKYYSMYDLLLPGVTPYTELLLSIKARSYRAECVNYNVIGVIGSCVFPDIEIQDRKDWNRTLAKITNAIKLKKIAADKNGGVSRLVDVKSWVEYVEGLSKPIMNNQEQNTDKNIFHIFDGGVSEIWFLGCKISISSILGTKYLQELLCNPGKKYKPLELESIIEGNVIDNRISIEEINSLGMSTAVDFQEVADNDAIKLVKKRLSLLTGDREEIIINDGMGAEEKEQLMEPIDSEIEKLKAYLKSANGKSGIRRTFSNEKKKSINRIRSTIKTAVKKISTQNEALAAHIDKSLILGETFWYAPDPACIWSKN